MNGATEAGRSMPPASPQAAIGAAIAGLRQDVGERVRADAVDARRPALLAERLARRGKRGALDDLRGAETP